ncbi:MAG: phage tail protein [Eubacteriales bacterium]|nr:phage tail protein [Eubacteriales bacterium]
MINLREGELLDILPCPIKDDPVVAAFSYALKRQICFVIEAADKARVYAAIEQAPERLLDIMAIQLRSMYYSEKLPLEIKREIVRNTLKWYQKAGTTAAVEELITILFGEGEVIEWYDIDPSEGALPGEFDIITNAQLLVDSVELFKSIIDKVKNVRSHLRRIITHREFQANLYVANVNAANMRIIIRDDGLHLNYCMKRENRMEISFASSYSVYQKIIIRDNGKGVIGSA